MPPAAMSATVAPGSAGRPVGAPAGAVEEAADGQVVHVVAGPPLRGPVWPNPLVEQ
jgi:hypothetical protein